MASSAVRLLTAADGPEALILYNELTVGPPAQDPTTISTVIDHPGTCVFGAFSGAQLASMVTLHLLPNVLWDGRPYALIENVVTRAVFQRRGFGRQVMETAVAAAWAANAHKIMLMTGTARHATGFYEAVGFTSKGKAAMVIQQD